MPDTQEDGKPFELTEEEERRAEEATSMAAVVVHEALRKEGESELARPTSALAWSGLAAGLSMGFTLFAEGLLQAHLPDLPWRPLITKFGYTIGFLIVILGSAETLYLATTGEIGYQDYLVDFFLPTLGGDIVGGVALVAALNHAQVVAGKGRSIDDQPRPAFRLVSDQSRRELSARMWLPSPLPSPGGRGGVGRGGSSGKSECQGRFSWEA